MNGTGGSYLITDTAIVVNKSEENDGITNTETTDIGGGGTTGDRDSTVGDSINNSIGQRRKRN
jgi:hypothetical protein